MKPSLHGEAQWLEPVVRQSSRGAPTHVVPSQTVLAALHGSSVGSVQHGAPAEPQTARTSIACDLESPCTRADIKQGFSLLQHRPESAWHRKANRQGARRRRRCCHCILCLLECRPPLLSRPRSMPRSVSHTLQTKKGGWVMQKALCDVSEVRCPSQSSRSHQHTGLRHRRCCSQRCNRLDRRQCSTALPARHMLQARAQCEVQQCGIRL